ncbi:hypothetical protein [Mycobacterium lacus]|uniref:hypothetical protein n=1 Tax=Mycobacterium lacus TaxID=169765 RepID=UPI000A14F6A6|nr:hypothetical protein [Mycobacterium lacus]MCV7125289.1 hypothetical protein [Mycobacterium lacus]ORW03772.1 hypothetical protein AWC15_04410 [Mycobacterium lacus]
MSVAADRPLNWNLLGVSVANPDGHQRRLCALQVAAEHGGRVVPVTLPQAMTIRAFRSPAAPPVEFTPV